MKATRPVDGIVLLDKPLGFSSNAALQRVKYLFAARKAGHSGSLDPLASGMLPICMGRATKLSAELLGAHKCYRFTLRLGTRTSSGDLEGEPVEQCPVPPLERDDVEAALRGFVGPQLQTPPMYSALKHQGQRLYALARKGIEVEREPRPIEIFSLAWEGGERPDLILRAVCSKGTYVRVLAEDIARSLGSCGHVTALRRLWVEPFLESQMVTLEQLEAVAAPADCDRWLLRQNQS